MADYNSGLPIRTESAGDAIIKVCDATVTSQQLAVNSDGSINIGDNGGSLTVDGTVELGATTLPALESITVSATDLDIRDLSASSDSVSAHLKDTGTAFSPSNPLPVTVSSGTPGDEINNYNTAASVAAGATSNHDYTVTALKTLNALQIHASASGKMKIEVQVAARMDGYVDQFQSIGGSLVMIAKGNRSPVVAESCRKHGGFYLGSIGGPAALLAQENIKKVELLEYPELGMEAIYKIEVENFPAFILVDDKGNDFFQKVSLPVVAG